MNQKDQIPLQGPDRKKMGSLTYLKGNYYFTSSVAS